METNACTNENPVEEKISRYRMIFFILTIMVFSMLIGVRVYADNTVNLMQGETKEIELTPFVISTPPRPLEAKAYKNETESSKVKVDIVGYYEHDGDGGAVSFSKIKITVAPDAEPGAYELRYQNLDGFYPYGELKTINIIASAQEESSPNTNTKKEEEEEEEEEAARQRANEEAAARAYWKNLNQGFPEGHTFFQSGGGRNCLQVW